MKHPAPYAPVLAAALAVALGSLASSAFAQEADEAEASTAAPADAPSASDAALTAQEVHQEHCATVASARASQAAEALSAVSAAWGALDEAFARTPEPYLVYWRGLMAQCLGQEEQGIRDLRWFLASSGDLGELSFMADDARRRLVQMGDDPAVRKTGGEAESGLLVEASAAVFDKLCKRKRRRQDNEPLTAGDIQEISDIWGRLGRATELAAADPVLVYWRGALALCLGQEERGAADLRAYLASAAWRQRGSPPASAVLERLLRIDVHVDRKGRLLPEGRVARRKLHLRSRGEFWGGGGLAVGGVERVTRLYAGTDLGTLWTSSGSTPWWESEYLGDSAELVPALSR